MQTYLTQNINDAQIKELAALMVQTFSLKVKHLWLFSKHKEKAAAFLERSICMDRGVYALQGERVMGFVGLNTRDLPFITYQLNNFVTCFGLLGGMWRYAVNAILSCMDKPLKEDEISIDAIAVSEQARGLGVGTMLLEKVFEIARHESKHAVLLEVVDTNPKAQALYEKKGFVVTRIENSEQWTAKAGFTSIVYMRKEIDDAR